MGCVSASDPIMRQCSGERNGRGGEGRRVGGRSGPCLSRSSAPQGKHLPSHGLSSISRALSLSALDPKNSAKLSSTGLEVKDQGETECNDPRSGGSEGGDEDGEGGGGGGGARPGLLGQDGCTKTQRYISGLNLHTFLVHTVRFCTHTQKALCKFS